MLKGLDSSIFQCDNKVGGDNKKKFIIDLISSPYAQDMILDLIRISYNTFHAAIEMLKPDGQHKFLQPSPTD